MKLHASDSFNRANGSAIGSTLDNALGGADTLTWAAPVGDVWNITSNTLTNAQTAADRFLYVNLPAAVGPQRFSIVATALDTGAMARYNPATGEGYVYYAPTGTVTTLYRRSSGGSFTSLGTGIGAATVGDRLDIAAVGNTLFCFRNGTLEIGPITDSNFAAGYPAIYAGDPGHTTVIENAQYFESWANGHDAWPMFAGQKGRGCNISPRTADMGDPYEPWYLLLYDWGTQGPTGTRWTQFVKPQLDAMAALGVNVVNLFFDSTLRVASSHGATLTAGELEAVVDQFCEYAASLGMWVLPRIDSYGITHYSLANADVEGFITEVAGYFDDHPNIVAMDVAAEHDATSGGTSDPAYTNLEGWFLAARAGFTRDVPLCASSAAGAAGASPVWSRQAHAIARGGDFGAWDNYFTPANVNELDPVVFNAGQGAAGTTDLGVVITEMGILNNDGTSPVTTRYGYIEAWGNRSRLTMMNVWALTDFGSAGVNDWGVYTSAQAGSPDYEFTTQRSIQCTALQNIEKTPNDYDVAEDTGPVVQDLGSGTIGANAVDLTWSAADNGGSSVTYTPQGIQVDANGFPLVDATWADSTPTSSTSATFTSLGAGVTYAFRLKMSDSAQGERYSNWVLVETATDDDEEEEEEPPTGTTEQLRIDSLYLGAIESRVRTGSGTPVGGATGDVYINYANGDVYERGASAWRRILTTGELPFSVPQGGTGETTFPQWGVLWGNSALALQCTIAGEDNEALMGNSGAAPTFRALVLGDLPTDSAGKVLISGTTAAWSASPSLTSIGGAANLTLNPTGDLILGPVGVDVLPNANYTVNLGALTNKYLTLHAAELWVETLVAQNTIATIGGRILVGPTTVLTTDLTNVATSIVVKHNEMASGDRVYMEANGSFEFMAITSGPSGSGPYTYSVTRNLDGSGANAWAAGDAIFNTGTTGDGFIDLYSVAGVLSGAGPTIVGNVRAGTTYNNIEPRWAIGNLNGLYGYGATTYGAAFGSPSAAWIKIDPTNGVRLGHNSTTLAQIDASGNATFTGSVTAASGAIGGFNIGTDYVRDAANSFGLASTVTGGDDVRFWAGDTFANRATAPFRLTEAGHLVIVGGDITLTSVDGDDLDDHDAEAALKFGRTGASYGATSDDIMGLFALHQETGGGDPTDTFYVANAIRGDGSHTGVAKVRLLASGWDNGSVGPSADILLSAASIQSSITLTASQVTMDEGEFRLVEDFNGVYDTLQFYNYNNGTGIGNALTWRFVFHAETAGFIQVNRIGAGVGTQMQFGVTDDFTANYSTTMLDLNGDSRIATIAGALVTTGNMNIVSATTRGTSSSAQVLHRFDFAGENTHWLGAIDSAGFGAGLQFWANVHTGGAFVVGVNDVGKAWFDTNGLYLGGHTAPSYLLELSADDAAKPTSSTWTIVSDSGAKDELQPFTGGLEAIRRLPIQQARYNGRFGTPTGDRVVGPTAQDAALVFPDSVRSKTVDGEPVLTFNAHEAFMANIVATQQLDALITATHGQFERRLARLEARLGV